MFDLEPTYFESQISEIVVPLFELADHDFKEWEKHINAEFLRAYNEVGLDAQGNGVYRETTIDEQRELIGAACLAFVATAIKGRLDSMASYFDSSHPPYSEVHRKKLAAKAAG